MRRAIAWCLAKRASAGKRGINRTTVERLIAIFFVCATKMIWHSKPRTKDDSYVSVDEAAERAYTLTLHSLGDAGLAEEVAFEVADHLQVHQRRAEHSKVAITPANSGWDKVRLNQASLIDRITFSELARFKQDWVELYQQGRFSLDHETLAVWFVEEIVNDSLRRDSAYVVVGVCKLLFNYKTSDVADIYCLINVDRAVDDAGWRRRKVKFIQHFLGNNFFADFLEKEIGDGGELRFTSKKSTAEEFQLVEDTLYKWTPLKPDCPLPDEDYHRWGQGMDEQQLAQKIADMFERDTDSKAALVAEQTRAHMLLHPHCLRLLLRALALSPPEEKLALPDFQLKDAGRPPINRRTARPMNEEQRGRIKAILGRREVRREQYSYKHVEINVNGADLAAVTLGERRSHCLTFDDGTDYVVKIYGQDDEGRLPLDVHFITFNEAQGDDPLSLTVTFKHSRMLHLRFSAERDASGALAGVVMDIEYARRTKVTPAKFQSTLSRVLTGWLERWNLRSKFLGEVVA